MREDTRTDTTRHSFLTHVGHLVRLRAALPGQTSLSLSDQPLTTYSRPALLFFPRECSGSSRLAGCVVSVDDREGEEGGALLCSARLCSARRRTQEDSRSPRCWKSERSLLSRALAWRTIERDPRAMTELRSRSVSLSHLTSALVDFYFIFIFSEPPLDVRAHMCATRLTAAAAAGRSLTSTCFVGKYWILILRER